MRDAIQRMKLERRIAGIFMLFFVAVFILIYRNVVIAGLFRKLASYFVAGGVL